MNINKVNNLGFKGTLDICGKEYRKNRKNEYVLKPTRKFIDTNDIKRIRQQGNDVVISYGDKEMNELYVSYSSLYKSEENKPLACYNLVLNAYNAAKNSDVGISIPNTIG